MATREEEVYSTVKIEDIFSLPKYAKSYKADMPFCPDI